jgi:hypothetical protein
MGWEGAVGLVDVGYQEFLEGLWVGFDGSGRGEAYAGSGSMS